MLNRRRGPDFVIKVINGIAGTAWVFIFMIFVFISLAKPKLQGFKKGMGAIKGAWDTGWLDVVFFLLIFLVVLSVLGIVFNFTRMKRKTDRVKATLVLSGILAVIGLMAFALR